MRRSGKEVEESAPDATVEVKQALVDGGIKLNITKMSVHYEGKLMRSAMMGWLSAEPAGTAELIVPFEGAFDLSAVLQVLSTMMSTVSKATIQVIEAIEKGKEDF